MIVQGAPGLRGWFAAPYQVFADTAPTDVIFVKNSPDVFRKKRPFAAQLLWNLARAVFIVCS